jgi:MoaA/NifB/PqqE/SkfB family radical SAM enzyme
MKNQFGINKLLNEKEIREKKVILDSLMKGLVITLSSRCNLKCIMCEVRNTQWDIPRHIIEEVIGLFPYLETVIWQGGEPFFLEYFEELFDEASKFSNLKQMIVTNGLLITDNWIERLVKNNVELTFSIDGVTREVYEQIRIGADFSCVISNLKAIRDARRKYNPEKMSLRLHVVVMRSNYYQLLDFIEFAREYGFNAVHLISMWGNNNSAENIFHNREKKALAYIDTVRERIEEKAKRYSIQLLNSLPCNEKHAGSAQEKGIDYIADNGLFCLLPWQQLNIDPGGGVRPGCLCLKNIGNILNNGLKDLWNNEQIQVYRKKIIDYEYKSWCNAACVSGQIGKELKSS